MKYQLYINATIGWPISAQYVRSVLADYQGKHVDVYVNSFGGSVVDALDIRQQFIDHGDVTCHIHGMTASAATLLAMGAKKVTMSKFALFLVHQCSKWVDTWGRMNASELADTIAKLQKTADDLATVDQVAANIYAERTGKDAKLCAEWMKEAKWLTAERCKELGLIDAICEDGNLTDVTDELRAQMVACGFPLPVPSSDGKRMTKIEQFMAAVKAFFAEDSADEEEDDEEGNALEDVTEEPITEDEGNAELETTTQETTTMESFTFEAICALLGVENLEGTQESISLTVAQLQTISDHISTVVGERDALQQQVDALLSGDGAEDGDVEGGESADSSIADCYSAIQSLV
ncbi:MAG: Clp protease ClpP [Bacteroidaceae bacterium]|nr:Clp protease ClpP [Bacteroidaceae bacterium]